MTTPLKVQVEPLSEQRWAKIEKSLFARLDAEPLRTDTAPVRRRLPIAWLAAAAAAALSVLLVVLASGAFWPGEAAVDRTSRIATGATGSHVALPGLSLDVQPESTVVVGGEPERSLLLVLDRGSIVCDVAPRASDSPLVIQAGAARVRVVGTRFSVSRDGESARVVVEHGVVEVSTAGRVWRVAAGQVWPAATPPAALPASPGAAAADAPAAPALAPAKQPARGAAPAPASEVVAAPQAPSSQAQFEQATLLERSEPARAAALYRALEGGSDSWAQNALYAHGRLEAARGDKAEARRLLQRYLARYPRGTNADDARAVLDRLK